MLCNRISISASADSDSYLMALFNVLELSHRAEYEDEIEHSPARIGESPATVDAVSLVVFWLRGPIR